MKRQALGVATLALSGVLLMSGCSANSAAVVSAPTTRATSTSTPSGTWWTPTPDPSGSLQLYQSPLAQVDEHGQMYVFIILTSRGQPALVDAWVGKKRTDRAGAPLVCQPAAPLTDGTQIPDGWECRAKFKDASYTDGRYYAIITSKRTTDSTDGSDGPLVRNVFKLQAVKVTT